MGSTGAFFDFDRTLIDVESPRLGILYLRRHRLIGPAFLLKVACANLLYKRGAISDHAMARILIGFYKGRQPAPFEEGAQGYWREVIRPHLAPAVVHRLREHQASGHVTVLVSAGLRYLLTPVAAELGFDHLLCTELEKGPDGSFTGGTVGPICSGAVKGELVRRLAEREGIDLRASYAYGDHEADLAMLELVGHPVAVEPTQRLRAEALKRNWPIVSHR